MALTNKKSGSPQRPTICHVLHSMCVGGAELLARELALRASGQFDVAFACLDSCGEVGEELRRDGWVVEVLGRKPGFDYGCAKRLAAFLRRHKVSVIHAHQYAPFFYSAVSRLGRHRTPILFLEHGRDYPDFRRRKRVAVNKLLLRRRDRIVAVGASVAKALVDFEGMPTSRVDVVYNGVNVDRYARDGEDRAAIRQELGLAADEIVLIQVARLNALKDHGTALRAMYALQRQGVRAHLFIVGEGEERPRIEALRTELKLEDAVSLLGTRHDVPGLLQAADVFLLSSVSEGIPLTLIEAMLAGLPVVSTRVGGVPEVVLHGETGLLSHAGDAVALSHSLETLICDGDMQRRMGQAGRDRAVEMFDDRAMHQAYQEMYRRILGEQGDQQNDVQADDGGVDGKSCMRVIADRLTG